MAWQLPRLSGQDDPMIATIWAEAHTIGVLAQGALTTIGRTLLDSDPDALLAAASGLLAPATTLGRFGSDLTVMVAGAPSAAVSALLDSCADRESRGAAVVWRFSPASVRRALDEGTSPDELRSGLRTIAETDLPQPLTYLIGDVARRHGSLIVQQAACCIRSDDEALLIEVAAHRGLRAVRPVLLAPTVIACAGEPGVVLGALRAAGYMPVLADESGVVQLGRSPVPSRRDRGSGAASVRTRNPPPGVGSSEGAGSGDPGSLDAGSLPRDALPDGGLTHGALHDEALHDGTLAHGALHDEALHDDVDLPERPVDRLREFRSRPLGGSRLDPVLRELAETLLAGSASSGAADRDREPTEVERPSTRSDGNSTPSNGSNWRSPSNSRSRARSPTSRRPAASPPG